MTASKLVDTYRAPEGAVGTILTVVGVLAIFVGFMAAVLNFSGDGGLSGATLGVYLVIAGFAFVGFASLVTNLEKVVWILQRSAIPANSTVPPINDSGEWVADGSAPKAHGELTSSDDTVKAST